MVTIKVESVGQMRDKILEAGETLKHLARVMG